MRGLYRSASMGQLCRGRTIPKKLIRKAQLAEANPPGRAQRVSWPEGGEVVANQTDEVTRRVEQQFSSKI